MRFSLFNCSTGILLFAITIGVQAGNIYKWTDAQGNVHYSQHKPKNHKTLKTIDVRGRTVNSKAPMPSSSSESINEKAETAKKPTKEQERLKELESQVKKQNDEMKKQRCESLKSNMDSLAIGGRMYETVNGKRKYLTGPEIEAKRKSVAADYQKDCS